MSSKTIEMAIGDIDSSERGTGARANNGKVSMSLIPWHLLAGCARVFMGGKLKYREWNWAKGLPWASCVDCTLRHFIRWWYLREDLDTESGEHHLDHILCNILMLRHYIVAYPEGDDRPGAELTRFPEHMTDFMKLFDVDDYLKRNPAIKAKLDDEEAEESVESGEIDSAKVEHVLKKVFGNEFPMKSENFWARTSLQLTELLREGETNAK